MRLLRVCVVGAAVAVLWQAPAFAAGDAGAAREQLKLGYNLKEEGKCAEAIPHLAESLRLDAKAITLINLADCEERTKKLADAMGHWVDARARAQAEGNKAIEEEATDRARSLEGRLARLTVKLAASAPPDASVERDGVVLGAPSLGVPLPVDPGSHALVVKAKGHADTRADVVLAEGEAKTLAVDVGPVVEVPVAALALAAERTQVSPLVWAGFGVAAVGVVVGAITGAKALSAGSDAETACPDLRCRTAAFDDVESGRHMATVSTIAFIAAGVGASVGLYGLFVASKPGKAAKTAWSLAPFALRAAF